MPAPSRPTEHAPTKQSRTGCAHRRASPPHSTLKWLPTDGADRVVRGGRAHGQTWPMDSTLALPRSCLQPTHPCQSLNDPGELAERDGTGVTERARRSPRFLAHPLEEPPVRATNVIPITAPSPPLPIEPRNGRQPRTRGQHRQTHRPDAADEEQPPVATSQASAEAIHLASAMQGARDDTRDDPATEALAAGNSASTSRRSESRPIQLWAESEEAHP